jgi:serine protease
MMSTFPVDVKGSLMSVQEVPDGAQTRKSLNPDDFRGGFAAWSGSSFSAPGLAATVTRARQALQHIGWQGG